MHIFKRSNIAAGIVALVIALAGTALLTTTILSNASPDHLQKKHEKGAYSTTLGF